MGRHANHLSIFYIYMSRSNDQLCFLDCSSVLPYLSVSNFLLFGPTTNWRGKKRETWSARSGSGPLSIYCLGNLDFAKAICHVGIVLGRLLVNSYPLIINDLCAIIYIKTLFKELIKILICRSAKKKEKKGSWIKTFSLSKIDVISYMVIF